jgi:hypothetical protein
MLRAVVLCVLAATAFAALPAAKLPELHQRIASIVTSGKVPTVAYTPGIQGTYLQVTSYLDSGCTTLLGSQFGMDGTCSTTGQPTSTSIGGAPASTNVSWDGTTLTGCAIWDSYTCNGQVALCATVGTASCTQGGFGYSKVSVASGSFVSSTGYNSTTCGGLPAGPSFFPVGVCVANFIGSIKVTPGYTQCNYTDTACNTQDYCVTCQSGACCTDPSFNGMSVRIGAASAVAPSLIVLAAAVLAALAF